MAKFRTGTSVGCHDSLNRDHFSRACITFVGCPLDILATCFFGTNLGSLQCTVTTSMGCTSNVVSKHPLRVCNWDGPHTPTPGTGKVRSGTSVGCHDSLNRDHFIIACITSVGCPADVQTTRLFGTNIGSLYVTNTTSTGCTSNVVSKHPLRDCNWDGPPTPTLGTGKVLPGTSVGCHDYLNRDHFNSACIMSVGCPADVQTTRLFGTNSGRYTPRT